MLRHQNNKALHSIPKDAKEYLADTNTVYNIRNDNTLTIDSNILETKKLKVYFKNDYQNRIKETWSQKPMHEKFPKCMNRVNIYREQFFKWINRAALKGETEGLVIAAQD